MEGAPPSPEGHLFSSTVMDTPARRDSGPNHTLSSTTEHRDSQAPEVPAWLSDCGSGMDFTLTLTRVGSLHVTSVHRTLTGTTRVMALNTPLPHGLSPCAQLSSCFPQGIRVRAAAPLSGGQTGGGGNGGEPWKEVGTSSGPEPRSPCHHLPKGLDLWLRCSQMAPC